MKKLFVLAIAILFAFSMNAQKFGVKVGMNLSDVNTNLEKPDGSKMGKGYHAGLVGELMLLKIVGVRAELLFSQKGSDIEDEVDVLGIITKTTIKQNDVVQNVKGLGDFVTVELIKRAISWFKTKIHSAKNFDELREKLNIGGFVKVDFCSINIR